MSRAWVFHRGSLGDSILLWPVLRALRASGRHVTFVTDASRAALAATELGITGVSAEQSRFNAMWRPDGAAAAFGSHENQLVLSFLADPATPSGQVWLSSASRMFPDAEVIAEPRRVDRMVALEYAARFGGSPPVPVRRNRRGPVVIHVGVGSEDKRLPMAWWLDRIRAATVRERPVLLAGEVERDRFSPRDCELFAAAGGVYIDDLPTLAETLKSARLYVGADTGPTHLAAALGVPTIAFFGPTDPARWAPIGPRVRVVQVSKRKTPVGAD